MNKDYDRKVFLNCPFDSEYQPLLRAMLFAVHDCGFIAECSLDGEDGSIPRVRRIQESIKNSRFSVHDISRTEPSLVDGEHLPRFNMPYELGLFIGAKTYGTKVHKNKRALILDRELYRYQKFLSDIAGQDIKAHKGTQEGVIKAVRDFLRSQSKTLLEEAGKELPRNQIAGGAKMYERFQAFTTTLPIMCEGLHIEIDELSYADYTDFVYVWLNTNDN